MVHVHKITPEDEWFLALNKKDPITGYQFVLGDRIVICAKCKAVYSEESWHYLKGQCATIGCGGFERNSEATLIDFSPESVLAKTDNHVNPTFIIHTKQPTLTKKPTAWEKIKRFFKNIFRR